MDGTPTNPPEDAAEQLTGEQRRLVELYARDPNPTKIAEILGVHRSTVYRRLDEPGVQEAIVQLRIKLDGERNTEIEQAQDLAIALIKEQLGRLKKKMDDDPDKASMADAEKLMRIAEKLGTMKKDATKATSRALADARKGTGEVDWGTEPGEDE